MPPNRPTSNECPPFTRASNPPVDPAMVDRRYLTTREATAYCGFKTTGALRKAMMEGRIRAFGRRGGGQGTRMWDREELDRYLRGAPIDGSGGPTAVVCVGVPAAPVPCAPTRSESRVAVPPPPSPAPAPRADARPIVPPPIAATPVPHFELRPAPMPSVPQKLYGSIAGELRYRSEPVALAIPDDDDPQRAPEPAPLPPRRGPGRPRKYPLPPQVASQLASPGARAPEPAPAPPRRGPGRPRKYPPPPPVASAAESEPCDTVPTTPSKGPRGRTAAVLDAPPKPVALSAREIRENALERIRLIGRPHLRRS